jgi:hypothetical protein
MNYNKKYNILQSQIGGSDRQPLNDTLKEAYAHYTNLKNNMSLYCDKEINRCEYLNVEEKNNSEYLNVEQIKYTPYFKQKDQKIDMPDAVETLNFATYDVTKMNDTQIMYLSEFIYKKIYSNTACDLINVYIISYKYKNVKRYKEFTKIFLIYRQKNLEIISICFVTCPDKTKSNEFEIKFLCSYVDNNIEKQKSTGIEQQTLTGIEQQTLTGIEQQTLTGINQLYPYKGLGNQFIDKVLKVLKIQNLKTIVKLISSERGHKFYLGNGFSAPNGSSYYTKILQKKYLKYKKKYLKLKRIQK